jgi:Lipocalin-like domain
MLREKTMRMSCWLGLVLVLIVAIPAMTQSGTPEAISVREKLVGAWKLLFFEQPGPDGMIRKLPRIGLLMYTQDGHVSLQILAPEGAPEAAAGPIQYEQGGYEAYFGTYTVDEKTSTVTQHIEGALVRSLIGKDLTRVCSFSGKQLTRRSIRSDEHWTSVWEHY